MPAELLERYLFGGTCYANNYYLYQLLAKLGYQINLCGADMSNPDVHLVNMVTVENREYLRVVRAWSYTERET